MHKVQVIDSHTEGEPTRVVIAGAPDFGGGSVAAQARMFRERFDWFRAAVVNEPRGSDALVGACIVPSPNPRVLCGVIFFNNVGLLHACGHGTIGLAVTLAHLGRAGQGQHLVDTPVGEVGFTVQEQGQVTIENVASYRWRKQVPLRFPCEGREHEVHGDIAWGGNWFFLVSDHGEVLALRNVERLTAYTWAMRQQLEREGIRGENGGLIDHIELFGAPTRADCDSKNFVLCPGKAYDRSPCGTGTSAKMACLYADRVLSEGREWRQESILGSRFVGRVRARDDKVLPSITGTAFVTAESTLLLDPRDPFCHGIR